MANTTMLTTEVQRLAEKFAQEQISGAGVNPQYLVNDAFTLPVNELGGADSVTSAGVATPTAPGAGQAAPLTGLPLQEEERENYLLNSSAYLAGLENNQTEISLVEALRYFYGDNSAVELIGLAAPKLLSLAATGSTPATELASQIREVLQHCFSLNGVALPEGVEISLNLAISLAKKAGSIEKETLAEFKKLDSRQRGFWQQLALRSNKYSAQKNAFSQTSNQLPAEAAFDRWQSFWADLWQAIFWQKSEPAAGQESSAADKAAAGSEKIETNEEVEALLAEILAEAGLSEKPAGMSDELYQQLVAQAIAKWVMENIEYLQDAGSDYWQGVSETLSKLTGDCEDAAILIASLLVSAGFDPDNVAVVISADGKHAQVAVEIGGEVFLIDLAAANRFQQTGYTSLDSYLANGQLVGAWFKQGSSGVNNSALEIETASGPGTGAPQGKKSADQAALDYVSSEDQALTESIESFDPDQATAVGDEDYKSINEKYVKRWMEEMMRRSLRMAAVALAVSMAWELKEKFLEAIYDRPLEESSGEQNTLNNAIFRKIQGISKIVQKTLGKLIDMVSKHNNALYQERTEDLDAKTKKCGWKFKNWWRGGEEAKKIQRESLKQAEANMKATHSAVKTMEGLLMAMMSMIVQGLSGGDKDAMVLGMMSGLKSFLVEIKKADVKIEEKLEEVRKELKDMESSNKCGPAWSKFWEGLTKGSWSKMWDGIKGMFRAAADWLEKYVPGLGHLISYTVLDPLQQGFSLIKDPVEWVLSLLSSILDLISGILDKIGGLIDKVLYTIYWLFGSNGYDTGAITHTWKNWTDTGGIFQFILGDIIGDIFIDKFLDNMIIDNIVEAIRFVLYEGVSRLWNKLPGWGKWLAYGLTGGGALGIDSLSDEGERDYYFAFDGTSKEDRTEGGEFRTFGKGKVSLYGSKDINKSKDVSQDGSARVLVTRFNKQRDKFKDDYASFEINLQDLIENYRRQMVIYQNIFRMYQALAFLRSELRNVVYQEMTGLSGTTPNTELLALFTEMNFGVTNLLFDSLLSQTIMRSQMAKGIVDIQQSLAAMKRAEASQAASVILTIAAIVVSIILIVFTFGGGTAAAIAISVGATVAAIKSALAAIALALSLAAAASNYSAQLELNSTYIYQPNAPPPTTILVSPRARGKRSASQQMLDTLENCERTNQQLMNEILNANNYVIQTKDGRFVIDHAAFAKLERQMNSINNAVRILLSLSKLSRELRNIIRAEMTGKVSTISGEALLASAIEQILGQRQATLSSLRFQLQETVATKNVLRSREIAMAKMRGSGSGVAGSLLTLISCIPVLSGLKILSAVLQILGSIAGAVGMIADSLSGEGNALGMKLDDTSAKELKELLEQKRGKSVEAKLDELENKFLAQALTDGLVSTGGGYWGVNMPLFAALARSLEKAANLKLSVAAARSMRSKLRAALLESLGKFSNSSSGDLSSALIQANFASSLRVLNSIQFYQSTRAQVLNLAEDARQNMIFSVATGAVSIALSSIGAGLGISHAVGTVGQLAGNIGSLMPQISSVLSSLAGMIFSAVNATKGNGFYSNYSVQNFVDKNIQRRHSNPQTVDERLDNLEYDAMTGMSTDLVQSNSGAVHTVSARSAELTSQVDAIQNIREALALVRSLRSELRRATGGKGRPAQFLAGVDIHSQAVSYIMDALKEALEIIASRESQKSEAAGNAISQAVTTLIQMAVLAVQIKSVAIAQKISDLEDKENKGFAADKSQDEKFNDLSREMKTYQKVVPFLSLANTLVSLALPFLTDARHSAAKDTKTVEAARERSLESSDKTNTKGKGEKGKSKNIGVLAALDYMDSAISDYNIILADAENQKQVTAYFASHGEKFIEFAKNLGQQLTSFIEPFKPNATSYPAVELAAQANPQEGAALLDRVRTQDPKQADRYAAQLAEKDPALLANVLLAGTPESGAANLAALSADQAAQVMITISQTNPEKGAQIIIIMDQKKAQAALAKMVQSSPEEAARTMQQVVVLGGQKLAADALAAVPEKAAAVMKGLDAPDLRLTMENMMVGDSEKALNIMKDLVAQPDLAPERRQAVLQAATNFVYLGITNPQSPIFQKADQPAPPSSKVLNEYLDSIQQAVMANTSEAAGSESTEGTVPVEGEDPVLAQGAIEGGVAGSSQALTVDAIQAEIATIDQQLDVLSQQLVRLNEQIRTAKEQLAVLKADQVAFKAKAAEKVAQLKAEAAQWGERVAALRANHNPSPAEQLELLQGLRAIQDINRQIEIYQLAVDGKTEAEVLEAAEAQLKALEAEKGKTQQGIKQLRQQRLAWQKELSHLTEKAGQEPVVQAGVAKTFRQVEPVRGRVPEREAVASQATAEGRAPEKKRERQEARSAGVKAATANQDGEERIVKIQDPGQGARREDRSLGWRAGSRSVLIPEVESTEGASFAEVVVESPRAAEVAGVRIALQDNSPRAQYLRVLKEQETLRDMGVSV